MKARLASPDDSAYLARIYNQGMEDRTATFETRPRNTTDVLAFAAASSSLPRACYAGIAEVSVYVDREYRGRGAGRLALSELARAAERAGFWKLLSRVFLKMPRAGP